MSATISSPPIHAFRASQFHYIDHIKVLLTVLVILHHTVVAYSTSGGWYYTEKTSSMAALVPMTMFVSLNQSFFMGFFFLLSAYFTVPSYDRKGSLQFITDRLLRLGIPLLFYSFVLTPFVSYLVYYFARGRHINFIQYLSGYHSWIDFGVMWFVAALIIFNLNYVFLKSLGCAVFKKQYPEPEAGIILLFAVVLGIFSFLVRVIFPVGWVLQPFGFQIGHFPQYIALFIIGLIAYRNQWFDHINERTGKRLKLSSWLCLLFFPVFFLIRIKSGMPVSYYSGGFHWQSLLYAVWEQWIGLSIITTILSYGRRSWNKPSPLLSTLSGSTFTVYVIHPLVIVILTLMLRNWTVDPVIKFLLVAPTAVLSSFLLGRCILVFLKTVKFRDR